MGIANFTVAGVEVLGSPAPSWTPTQFYHGATNSDKTSLADVRSKQIPFTLELRDWSGMVKGLAMPCETCGHTLSEHVHQRTATEFYVEHALTKQTSIVTECDAKMSLLEQQKLAVKALEDELSTLDAQEAKLKVDLRQNMQSFESLAVTSSYVKLLNEQVSYLDILMECAKSEGQLDHIKIIQSQLDTLNLLKDGIELVSSPTNRK